MIDAIFSRLGKTDGPFPWEAVLVLILLVIAYGLIERTLGIGLRRLWRRLTRQNDA